MTRLLVCGAINWDTTCLVAHLPSPGEEVSCESISEVPGGTGANVAVAAARILGRGEVALFAALGKDNVADVQLSFLEGEGVVHEPVVRIGGQPSGHAYIFVDYAGQNVIASHLGANAALNTRHARQAGLSTLLQDCRCIVVTDPPLPVAAYLLRAAADLDIPALWDPGVLAHEGWTSLSTAARGIDSLILNEAEAQQLLGTSRPTELQSVLRNGPLHIVLKRGEQGAVMIPTGKGPALAIPPLPLAQLDMNVVNAVGCGDVFLGTYAAFLSEGTSRDDSLLMASAASGYNATRPETRGGPDRETLEDLVRRAQGPDFRTRTLEHYVD
jgi:ribokinase